METLEEALEQAKKELEEEGTYRMPTTAYPEEEWEEQKVKGWPRPLHIFGVRQNQVNMGIGARLRALEIQNRALEIRMERLEDYIKLLVEREQTMMGRVAAELNAMESDLESMRAEVNAQSAKVRKSLGSDLTAMRTDIDRLRLSTQLNSNAIDRILKGPLSRPETPSGDAESVDMLEKPENPDVKKA